MTGLREVSFTAPYTPDGSQLDLADVIHLYLMGSEFSPAMDPRADAIKSDGAETADLSAFLVALNGNRTNTWATR
jgi:cytochrome c peroxidase